MSFGKDWLTRIWLPVSEVARLEARDERTIRSRCKKTNLKGGYVWRPNAETKDIEIRLSSLTGDAICKYDEEQLPDYEPLPQRENPAAFHALYESSSAKQKKKCDKWTIILRHFSAYNGSNNLRTHVEQWNREHNKSMQTSLQRLYAIRREYRKNGGDRSFLLLGEKYTPESSVKDEWWEDFKEVYLTQQRRSVEWCQLYALGRARDRARERGENVEECSFPSQQSFRRRLNREVKKEERDLRRNGPKKGHYDRNSSYVQRDYSSVQAGSCWVGDTRTFDVLVKVPGFDKPKRPYITAFIDMRTSKYLGWHVHHTPPCTENTLRALKSGIAKHGIPEVLYVDNGREYSNKNVSGESRHSRLSRKNREVDYSSDNPTMWRSMANIFNIDMQFATPYNARAKIIEGDFAMIKENFDKNFKAYFGGNSVERPEQVKTLKDKDYVSFDEFKNYVSRHLEHIHPYLKTNSIKHEYSTKQEAWDILYSQRSEPLKAASQASLDRLVTLTVDCCINRNGANIRELGVTWWSEFMCGRMGDWIVVRYDPDDLNKAWGYEKNGEFIDEMGKVETVPAMISLLPQEEQEQAREKLRERMTIYNRKKKIVKELANGDPVAERQIFDAIEYGLHGEIKSGTPSDAVQPATSIAITKHDADKQKLKERSEYGDPELLQKMFG